VDFSSPLRETNTCHGHGAVTRVFLLSLRRMGLQSILGKRGTTLASVASGYSMQLSLWGRDAMQSQQSTRTWRTENTLDYLHIVLKELDRVGDFTVPSIVKLRSLIAQRISSVEAVQETGMFGAAAKYESIQGVPL